MRRIIRLLTILLVVVIAGAALAGGALAWRLTQGPLSLTPVAGLIQQLVARGTPYAVSFADPALEWSAERDALLITARDIDVRTRDGELVAAAPSAGVRIDATALIYERSIAVRDVDLRLPAMQVQRGRDGRFSLAFDGKLATLPLADAAGPGLLETLGRGREEARDPRLERLRRIRVTAASLRYTDVGSGTTAETGRARLRLTRDAKVGWELALSVVPAGPGSSLELEATAGDAPGLRSVEIGIVGMPVTTLAGVAPSLRLEGSEVRFDGRALLSVDLGRQTLVGGAFSLSSAGGTVAAPGQLESPLTLGAITLDGRIDATTSALELTPVETMVDGVPVRLTAGFRGRDFASLNVTSPGLDRDRVQAVWPLPVGPQARRWFIENVRAGLVTDFTLTRRESGRFEIDGTAREVDLRVLPSWPDAGDVSGRLRFADRRLDLTLERGSLAGVNLRGGALQLIDRPDGPTSLSTDLKIDGPVPAVLALLARPPLKVRPGIEPDDTEGMVAADVRLDLPTLRDPPRDQVRFAVSSRLRDLVLRRAIGDLDATSADLRLTVDERDANAEGPVALAGVPLDVRWNERFRPEGDRRRVVARGTIGPLDLAALGGAWNGFRNGSAAVEATLVEPRRGPRRIDVTADLAQADLQVAAIGLAKAAGAPGSARATVVDDRPRRLAVDAIDVDLRAATIRGGVELDPATTRWRSVSVDQLVWPRGRLSASLEKRGETITGRIDADRLDLRELRPRGAEDGGAPSQPPPLDLALTARELILGSRPFQQVTASVARDRARWHRLVGEARLPGGAPVTVRIGAEDAPDRVTAEAQDFGALLAALGLGDRTVEGGRVRIDGVLGSSGGPLAEGELKAREFVIREAPTIARILSLASFQGIGDTLGGRGLQVDRLTVPFTYLGEEIRLRQARLVGSQIGGRVDGTIDLARRRLNLEGTAAPLYTLNRIIGQIPIIGGLLRGDRADAALAATFSIGGTFSEPQINVNPLAAIVPGVIRDLFRDAAPPPPAQREPRG